MTTVNKPSVNDTTINYNLKVGTLKSAPKQAKQGEAVSTLSTADQIWQGTKSGLKLSAWTGSSALAGFFTTPDYRKFGDAAGANVLIGLAPIAVGAVSGTVSAIIGKDDKVGKAMHRLAGGPLTATSAGFKAGIVANGLLMPRLAASALDNVSGVAARFATGTAFGLTTVATTTASAALGAKFAKSSASSGGAVFAGAAGGALTGAAGGAIMEIGRHAIAGTLKAEGNIKGALFLGALYGAAAGIGGALIQYHTRKAS